MGKVEPISQNTTDNIRTVPLGQLFDEIFEKLNELIAAHNEHIEICEATHTDDEVTHSGKTDIVIC